MKNNSPTSRIRNLILSDEKLELTSLPFSSSDIPIGVIYKITNRKNNKIYIGKSTNFKERLRHYCHILAYGSSKNYWISNPDLQKDLCSFSARDFDIHIIAYAYSDLELANAEAYLISKYIEHNFLLYNTNPEKIRYSIKKMENVSSFSISKKLKSEPIIAYNFKEKEIFICDGLKAFGNVINQPKDMVKNFARKLRPIRGKNDVFCNQYIIIYLSDKNYQYLLDLEKKYLFKKYLMNIPKECGGIKRNSGFLKFFSDSEEDVHSALLYSSEFRHWKSYNVFPENFLIYKVYYNADGQISLSEVNKDDKVDYALFDK